MNSLSFKLLVILGTFCKYFSAEISTSGLNGAGGGGQPGVVVQFSYRG
jgi:hypothetical protein